MSQELEPLSSEAERVLEAERARPPEADAMRARVLERLRASVAAPGAGAAPSPPSAATAAAQAPRLLPLGTFLAGMVAGGVVGAVAYARWTEAPDRAEQSAPAPAPQAPSALPELAPVAEAEVGTPPAPALPARPLRTEPPEGRSADAALERERTLLERARAALARGRPELALQAAQQHEAEFPRGRLREERELLSIQALAAQGEHAAARKRAERFRRDFPHSLLVGAVEELLWSAPGQDAGPKR
jgi:hypothetical protein